GGNVSILWGLVQYTKEQPRTATVPAKATVQTPATPEVVAHDISFADAMAMGRWFRRRLPKPCIVRITATNDNINFRNILAMIVSVDGECEIGNASSDSQVAPIDADATVKPPAPGVIVRGPEEHGRALAMLLSGLGMKASWGSRPPDGGHIQ